MVRETTEAGNLASLNSGVGGDAALSGGHLVICESAEVIELLLRLVAERAAWGGDGERVSRGWQRAHRLLRNLQKTL